ncbi:VOC family protein [Gemmatimonas groenlandica]|uniref:VOC family protein n=2 Tax=Gemmatimonas groenlandica TaxID=2732249 RepID=A0A6M4IUJ1_9BACT|nr:VOC family protein [Gemmatimonas groenlandica]
MFGAPADSNTGADRALLGSYGRPPAGYRLPAATRLGTVELQVSNLARSLEYYQLLLGLAVVAQDEATASLAGVGATEPIVILREVPGTRPVAPGSRLGLYHFAILLPDRPAMGRFITHLSEIGARAGSSDHLVSEALYLQDPDGLGIEVYVDRPRDRWRRVDQELMMATDPLDMADLVRVANGAPWTGMPSDTVMGHVHLHVGDLDAADAFYSEGLGFDRMVWRYPGALFLGAGGYHHHLGTNTWAGGALPPRTQDAKLTAWTIVLPSANDVAALRANLVARGIAVTDEPAGILFADPWGTPVRVRT